MKQTDKKFDTNENDAYLPNRLFFFEIIRKQKYEQIISLTSIRKGVAN